MAIIAEAVKLLKMSRNKYERVMYIQRATKKVQEENKTYCVLTLFVLRMTQCFLVLIIVFLVVEIMIWIIGPFYQKFFSSPQSADGCVKDYLDFERPLPYLYNILVCLVLASLVALVISQLFEWISMIFIIIT
jgi:uncharacterized protein involved in cysteine biosynthesis